MNYSRPLYLPEAKVFDTFFPNAITAAKRVVGYDS